MVGWIKKYRFVVAAYIFIRLLSILIFPTLSTMDIFILSLLNIVIIARNQISENFGSSEKEFYYYLAKLNVTFFLTCINVFIAFKSMKYIINSPIFSIGSIDIFYIANVIFVSTLLCILKTLLQCFKYRKLKKAWVKSIHKGPSVCNYFNCYYKLSKGKSLFLLCQGDSQNILNIDV